MTGIPLASVVAFLRPRGALGVLEGAPLIFSANPDGVIVSPLAPDLLERLARSGPGVSLYLGSGEICPAAEGWTARVLAMAKGLPSDSVGVLNFSATDSIILEHFQPLVSGLQYPPAVWVWNAETYETLRIPVGFLGPPPSTPAERLAAVLRYEMERAR